jgi:hypothetical protein
MFILRAHNGLARGHLYKPPGPSSPTCQGQCGIVQSKVYMPYARGVQNMPLRTPSTFQPHVHGGWQAAYVRVTVPQGTAETRAWDCTEVLILGRVRPRFEAVGTVLTTCEGDPWTYSQCCSWGHIFMGRSYAAMESVAAGIWGVLVRPSRQVDRRKGPGIGAFVTCGRIMQADSRRHSVPWSAGSVARRCPRKKSYRSMLAFRMPSTRRMKTAIGRVIDPVGVSCVITPASWRIP